MSWKSKETAISSTREVLAWLKFIVRGLLIELVRKKSYAHTVQQETNIVGHARNAYGTVTTISKPAVSRLQPVLIVVMHAPRTAAVPKHVTDTVL